MLLNTGVTPSTDIDSHPIPSMPSNLAAMNVIPGWCTASPNVWFFTHSPATYGTLVYAHSKWNIVQVHTDTDIDTQTHTHIDTYTQTDTHTHAHTHTHTDTDTHTHRHTKI